MIQPTLISLNPNDYSQELSYCLFPVKLDRCVGSCDTLNNKIIDLIIDVSNKIYLPN